MTRRRRSLRERDEFAIAQEPAEPTPEPTTPATPADEKSTRRKPKPEGAPRVGATSQRTGIYFHAERRDNAKSAYLADWQAGGEADTFSSWIAAAIDQHAGRTSAERAELADNLAETAHGQGLTRTFDIPDHTVQAMRKAIIADQAHGRWTSQSEFMVTAIAAAVETSRTRAGGTLPPPPKRLPNRLIR